MHYFLNCKLLTLMTSLPTDFSSFFGTSRSQQMPKTLTKWKHYFRYSKDCKTPLKVCLLSQADLKKK